MPLVEELVEGLADLLGFELVPKERGKPEVPLGVKRAEELKKEYRSMSLEELEEQLKILENKYSKLEEIERTVRSWFWEMEKTCKELSYFRNPVLEVENIRALKDEIADRKRAIKEVIREKARERLEEILRGEGYELVGISEWSYPSQDVIRIKTKRPANIDEI